MRYYRISSSVEINVIGFSPQVSDGIVDFNLYDEKSAIHLNFSKADEFTLWPVSVLSKKAKKTDLISNSFMSLGGKLFISIILKNILFKINFQGVQFVKSKLIFNSNLEEEYWILNPYLSDYSFLDVKKSEFVFKDMMLSKTTDTVIFNTIQEYLEAFKKNNRDSKEIGYPIYNPLIIDKIAIKEDCEIDFFSISKCNSGIGFFVSENLKNEIEEAGCTGIIFTELNEQYP